MLEILKLFAEQLVKALNIEVLLARRDKSKLAEVGASLFSLYSSLNGIHVHGQEIASCIRDILRDYENAKQAGEEWNGSWRTYTLCPLLSNQRVNIRNFTAAFRSLYDYIGIVDPQSLRKAELFISEKMP